MKGYEYQEYVGLQDGTLQTFYSAQPVVTNGGDVLSKEIEVELPLGAVVQDGEIYLPGDDVPYGLDEAIGLGKAHVK